MLLIPWPSSGRIVARKVAERLAAVVADLSELQPPVEDESEIRRRYLTPLKTASEAAADFARRTPRGSRFASTIALMGQHVVVWPDDSDHNFVVRYDLPQWWLPRTASWDPRPPSGSAS